MRARMFSCVGAAFGLLIAANSAAAHHSFAAQYDANKPVELKGVVTKVEFMNPHIYFYVDVKDENGRVVNWAIEGGTPNSLRRAGWGKESLKVGDGVTVNGSRAKNGTNLVNMRTVVLADGRRVLGGSSEGQGR
jgi:hypothetical protein